MTRLVAMQYMSFQISLSRWSNVFFFFMYKESVQQFMNNVILSTFYDEIKLESISYILESILLYLR